MNPLYGCCEKCGRSFTRKRMSEEDKLYITSGAWGRACKEARLAVVESFIQWGVFTEESCQRAHVSGSTFDLILR